ncbi:hypothetical protein A5482_004105 [Cyanobacterium sp. IPPAS B-1200]|uniref:hypothetical protein n=1 Tax=Cyanobacterium sp. IPPAS B-1200 TaxID=1562720 RepID=UPI000852805D|nr:hypothetical protein [Cyanobacterium sp. IPPAS B-1200]OEJ78338.1 hypothetical protein A5482_03645 [Cyanobacterium sp. IPPAS B-1200]
MKYFTLLISWVLLILPLDAVRAESTTIDAGDVGYLMGGYMCKSLLTTGSMNDPDILDEFAQEATEKYSDEESEQFLSLMTDLILTENIGDDPASLELMRGAFDHIINDDDCFRAFLNESQGMGSDSEFTD